MRVVVVEEHHCVLPWIQLGMRRSVVKMSGVQLVHWDAHPDMGALDDASACFKPRELMDALDDSIRGISEWILPLIYCGHVDRVDWVRPSFAKQIADGEYFVNVGSCDSRLGVDSRLEYFKNDYGEILEKKKRFLLCVSQTFFVETKDWILDVCCDYFSCRNPLLDEGEDLPQGGANTVQEIDFDHFRKTLKCQRMPPRMVTVARSADDGYTPSELADAVQAGIIEVVREVYGNITVFDDTEGRGPLDSDLKRFQDDAGATNDSFRTKRKQPNPPLRER